MCLTFNVNRTSISGKNRTHGRILCRRQVIMTEYLMPDFLLHLLPFPKVKLSISSKFLFSDTLNQFYSAPKSSFLIVSSNICESSYVIECSYMLVSNPIKRTRAFFIIKEITSSLLMAFDEIVGI